MRTLSTYLGYFGFDAYFYLERRPAGSWRQALLAGLPHLLWGLMVGLGLVVALASAVIVRLGNWFIGMGLALGINALAGVVLAYTETYLIEIPWVVHQPNPFEFLIGVIAYLTFSCFFFTAPLFLWSLWDYSHDRQARL